MEGDDPAAVGQMDGPPAAKRRTSTFTQIRALAKKNVKVHMRTNALFCCDCGSCTPVNACCLHFLCPILFVFVITAIPYILVKQLTSNPESFLEVNEIAEGAYKRWPGFEQPSYSFPNGACNIYGHISTDADDGEGSPESCFINNAVGVNPLLDTIFWPRGFREWSFIDSKCAGFPTSCHCQTVALVGPDDVVDAFKAYIEEVYLSWRTTAKWQDADARRYSTHQALNEELGQRLGLVADRRLSGEHSKWASLKGFRKNMTKAVQQFGDKFTELLNPTRRIPKSRRDRRLTFTNPWILNFTEAAADVGAADDCDQDFALEVDYCDVESDDHRWTIFRKFSSKEQVDEWIDSESYGRYHKDRSETSPIDRLCAAIIFENDVRSGNAKYTIRANVSVQEDIASDLTKVEVDEGLTGPDYLEWYWKFGFLGFQHLIQNFIANSSGIESSYLTEDPHFIIRPTEKAQSWGFGEVVGGFLGNPFVLSSMFGPIVSSIAFYVSSERSTRQRELLRMMGLSDAALLWSWVLLFVACNIVISFFMSALFLGFFFQKAQFFIIWMSIWWFANATVTFGMAVAAFVSTDRLAAMAAFGLFFAVSFLNLAIQDYDPEWVKTLYSLLPPNGFLLLMSTIWEWEQLGVGATTANGSSNIQNYNVNLGIWMQFLDFWLYLIIYYYFDNIVPWHGVGVPRKPWFCLTASYWREVLGRPPLVGQGSKVDDDSKIAIEQGSQYVEAETDAHLTSLVNSDKCAIVRNLQKSFTNAQGDTIHAVQNLSFTMYQDECFCLLGHNGAGKTTTMLMLTGQLVPSAGLIVVKGHTIPEQLREIRSSMGYCPQHNVLFDKLTVREHLELFGTIGGMRADELKLRGQQLLTAVALMDKINARASALSGGMKRKLSAALAFLSKPYLVILDEPSSGMDPFARRGMWDTLKQWRSGHLLCLTTHYMDEADALGDRIAIMSEGRIACSGSSTFLKQKFGCGYVISFAKVEESKSQDAQVLHMVRGVVGTEAQIMSSIGKELLIQVPFSAAATFPTLFPRIDSEKEKLRIESYGTSITNLEEVFLKVAKMFKDDGSRQDSKENSALIEEAPQIKQASFMLQLSALLLRRFKFGYRNRLTCACQLGLPVVCIFVFCFIIWLTTVTALPLLVLRTTPWNEDVNGPSVPTTIATVSGNDALNADEEAAWNLVPGIDQLYFSRQLEPIAYPFSASPPYGPTPSSIATGVAEEAAFIMQMESNEGIDEGIQYGSVFYPNTSSWCPPGFPTACSPDRPGVTVAVDVRAPHAAALLYSAAATATLKRYDVVNEIQVTNHPFQKTSTERDQDDFLSGIFAATIIMASYGFIPSGATSYVVMEKEKDVKNQLIISGCSYVAYWTSNFIFDVIWGLIPCAGAVITFWIFDLDSYINAPGLAASILLFIAFQPAMASFAYLFSFLFSKAGVALFCSWIFNMLFGIIATIICNVMVFIDNGSMYSVTVILRWIFRFVPVFSLGYGHLTISLQQRAAAEAGVGPLAGLGVGGADCTPREDVNEDAFKGRYIEDFYCTYMVGDEFLILLLSSLAFLAAVMGIDVVSGLPAVKRRFAADRSFLARFRNTSLEDSMVIEEKDRVAKLNKDEQMVFVNNIHKVYNRSVYAVRGISFAAAEGQVFGLLGVNGAGKTTTFKMLCGQVDPSDGEVCIQGYNVATRPAEARKLIGYCPQFDALLDTVTTKEHLELYGSLKGLKGTDLTGAVATALKDLDLRSYHSSRAGQLSGGNKRKLSVAMATIGEPPMVFLDEPSAGMDPVARRGMWSVIQTIADKRKKSVVILTTHSMEEAEALCSRIAIQVDGQFRCLGTAQQIKSRYGQGLELNVRVATPTLQEVIAVRTSLGLAQVEESVPEAVARAKIAEHYGEHFVQDLMARSGTPLVLGQPAQVAPLLEWVLLLQRQQEFEKFLQKELGPEAPQQNVAAALEKSQNVTRYQIYPAVLQGRYKSLGVLFNLFEANKERLNLQDFHLCQPSLEQVFNRFATTQAAQQQASSEGPASAPRVESAGNVHGTSPEPDTIGNTAGA